MVHREVPSVWRVLQRDDVAQVTAVVFLFGIAALVAFALEQRDATAASAWWAAAGMMCMVPAPTRIWSVRRWFRDGPEVVAHVVAVGRASAGSLPVDYRYTYGGRAYTGFLESTSVPQPGDALPVLVDARHPSRSLAKRVFLDAELPVARVVSR